MYYNIWLNFVSFYWPISGKIRDEKEKWENMRMMSDKVWNDTQTIPPPSNVHQINEKILDGKVDIYFFYVMYFWSMQWDHMNDHIDQVQTKWKWCAVWMTVCETFSQSPKITYSIHLRYLWRSTVNSIDTFHIFMFPFRYNSYICGEWCQMI